MSLSTPKPQFFNKQSDFRRWLRANHAKATDIWVGFYKVGSGKPTISYKEAVDEALCFGWIDGIRKSIDGESYTTRFTPRKKSSNWSRVNIKRIQELEAEGRMHAAGLLAFQTRDQRKTNQYSFEQGTLEFSPAQLKLFKANKPAWAFFQTQPPSYRKPATWWVLSAKQEATRERRLAVLIADSANELRIASMRPARKAKS